MSHKTAVKIYEIASYVLILAATALMLVPKLKAAMEGYNLLAVIMILIALATAARWGMEHHRFRSAEGEIDQLQGDVRRLTQLLAEEKKKNNQTIKQ